MVRNSIAIILARGGSKRLPRKNILDFKSKPLISWTIEAALNSRIYDTVLVSTDDNEIAEISKQYGAEVPFLRQTASDDYSPSSLATYAALTQAEEYYEKQYEYVTQLMANCPLRTSQDIKNGFKAFELSNASSQISCFKFGWMNPWWSFKLTSENHAEKLFPEALKQRSQDLPDLYCPTGAIWIAKRDDFLENKNFYMKNTRYEPLDWISAVDIDEYKDFMMAEICYELRNKNYK